MPELLCGATTRDKAVCGSHVARWPATGAPLTACALHLPADLREAVGRERIRPPADRSPLPRRWRVHQRSARPLACTCDLCEAAPVEHPDPQTTRQRLPARPPCPGKVGPNQDRPCPRLVAVWPGDGTPLRACHQHLTAAFKQGAYREARQARAADPVGAPFGLPRHLHHYAYRWLR